MTQEDIIAYINERKFMVIATKGAEWPEAACVEFGNDGLTLIFDTKSSSRKYLNIIQDPRVSVVIGWEDERTVQYQGLASILVGEELDVLKKAYFLKSPEAQKWESKDEIVYFKIEPKWVRYTDLNTDPWEITLFEF